MWALRIVLASGNRGKFNEISRIAAHYRIEILYSQDYENPPDVIEDGETFFDNALKKAEAFSIWCGGPALADDSGLCVDSLGGDPGVHSARYAGEGATDDENVKKLLYEMRDISGDERRAYFVCVAVVAWPRGGYMASSEGVCEGIISLSPHGSGGFGYDPVFIPDGCRLTMAQLSPDKKDALSHRGKAMREIFLKLTS